MDLALQTTAVIAVLGCLAGFAWIVRRGGFTVPPSKSSLAAAGRMQLTPQHSLHIIQFANRRLLVATYPSGCTVIDSAPAEETP